MSTKAKRQDKSAPPPGGEAPAATAAAAAPAPPPAAPPAPAVVAGAAKVAAPPDAKATASAAAPTAAPAAAAAPPAGGQPPATVRGRPRAPQKPRSDEKMAKKRVWDAQYAKEKRRKEKIARQELQKKYETLLERRNKLHEENRVLQADIEAATKGEIPTHAFGAPKASQGAAQTLSTDEAPEILQQIKADKGTKLSAKNEARV